VKSKSQRHAIVALRTPLGSGANSVDLRLTVDTSRHSSVARSDSGSANPLQNSGKLSVVGTAMTAEPAAECATVPATGGVESNTNGTLEAKPA
jgi:hypothetical protein